ncbi:MAG: L-fucose:H+ symporter permease [Paludibacter sp.]|jgi:FHS family L-fucose permease-like MFS transporter|nr:L-fucose:H+ symporter permease [Paludibacter sp.]
MKNTQHFLFRGANGRNYIVPFVLVTSLFALWGFANDITNPMVAAFKNILLITNFESSLVQFAFYGGYCVMAIPAAVFIKRFNYKNGILMGLALYSAGCFMFIPAGNAMSFAIFLLAYFIMTCGLSFLETTANPYILSMGTEQSATRRLNFAQAFNPMGSFTGMMIARNIILARLNPATEAERQALLETNPELLVAIQQSDLDIVSGPYLMLGAVVFAFLLVFLFARLPQVVSAVKDGVSSTVGATVKRLVKNKVYLYSVVAQAFYVGVQIMVWTFIIQYGENELGMEKKVAQDYNMIAMAIFITSRFICTYFLKYVKPYVLVKYLAIGGGAFTFGAIFIHGMAGMYCLVAVSACMSLMFPTIYGIALDGLGDDAKLASAGLILAIGGGAIFPPLQGLLMDEATWFGATFSATRISFILPLLCFAVIVCYGRWVGKQVEN